jgi:ATP-dependent DNA helicase RecG
MSIPLGSPIKDLPGLGSTAVGDLGRLGVKTVRDLLWYAPFRYDDLSTTKPISSLRHDDVVTLRGVIKSISGRRSNNNRVHLTEAIFENETGAIKVVWFNQPYLEKTLAPGTRVTLAGQVSQKYGATSLISPVYEKTESGNNTGRIVPIYGLTGSLTQRRLRGAIKYALKAAGRLVDWLPEKILEDEDLLPLAEAISEIHFPSATEALESARERLKFEELFLHQLLFAHMKRDREKISAQVLSCPTDEIKVWVEKLPFQLTKAQRVAAWEIVKDLEKDVPMQRLLQGDVGSGKTVVAALAAFVALRAGASVAYLAPTSILAEQQQRSFLKFLSEFSPALLTSGLAKIGSESVKKKDLLAVLKTGECRLIVGTHALIEDAIEVADLGLVIIDEQHRFGVAQRHALLRRNEIAPHLLSMTATPIPRSLALTIYGDLDLSILNELPPGRQPITTELIGRAQEDKMYSKIVSEIENSRQVFVICPLIDPSDALGVLSVEETEKKLAEGPLKKFHVAKLHGRMKADEKEKIMGEFAAGKIDVLISTTVVEVGVDIPNASVMLIFGAERFGLAQLHQLRGRVGRGSAASFCFLHSTNRSPAAWQRLQAMVKTQDGFKLAEADLKLRGGGDFFGEAQSGFPEWRFASFTDSEAIKKARDWAKWVLGESSDLSDFPLVRQKVQESFERVHLE